MRIYIATLSMVFISAMAYTLGFNPTPTPPPIPKGDFGPPVGHGLLLTGTFAELRPNHFHGGLDIKPSTKGRDGDPILSVADGFISRIRLSAKGYGHCLYVSHPNGYTSVYAHLSDFTPSVNAYLKGIQNLTQEYNVDVAPDSELFKVKKGEVIGAMGNTGHSFGTHLHFEMRETSNDKAMNPLLFGFSITDTKPPVPKMLRVYAYDEDGNELKSQNFPVIKAAGGGYMVKDSIRVNGPKAGFAVMTDDDMDFTTNKYGIYQMDLKVNNEHVFGFKLDAYLHEDTRYINAHMDYVESNRGRKMHRCFKLPGNKLEIYQNDGDNGLVTIADEGGKSAQIDIRDYHGNLSYLNFDFKRRPDTIKLAAKPFNYSLPFSQPSQIETQDFIASFPAFNFYRNLNIMYNSSVGKGDNIYSLVHHIGDAAEPVHGYYKVKIKPYQMPSELMDKAVIVNYYDRDEAFETTNLGDVLEGKIRRFGSFCVVLDQTSPSVSMVEKSSLKKPLSGKVSFVITDNISGVKSYKAYLDGEWRLLEHIKGNRFTLYLDEGITSGEHSVRISTSDVKGNEGEWTGTIWVK